MKTLTVVSPVYREAEVIADFYHALKDQLHKLSAYQTTILFVVDPGGDDTLRILKNISQQDQSVRILSLSTRFGHQMSLLAGIDHADSDVVIMMDSDLQHPPALIPQFLAEFEKGSEIVNAIREDTENITAFKKATSHLFYWILNYISTVKLSENAPDFRLITRRVASHIKKDIRERNLFLRGIMRWIGFKQTNVRFVAMSRSRGQSKYSLTRLLGLGLSGLIAFSRKPLRMIFCFGAITILFSAVAAFFLNALIALVFLMAGLQFIFLGIIGEYVGAILEEVRARPHYIIDEKINF